MSGTSRRPLHRGAAALEQMIERINLVPQQALGQQLKKITPIIVAGLLSLGLIVVYVIGQRLERKIDNLDREITLLEARSDGLSSQQTAVRQVTINVDQLRGDEKKLRTVVAHLANIPKQKQRFSDLLLGIGRVIPSTVRCDKIVLNDKSGQISGQATIYRDLPAFVQSLEELPRFRSVSLHVLNQGQGLGQEIPLLTFNIVFQLRGQR